MSGLLKVGRCCIEIPMFSESAQLRAGHGRRGEAVRELARALGESRAPVLVLGAGFGERMADLKAGGLGSVLCLEADADRFPVLERNVRQLGGNTLRARLGGSAPSPGDDAPTLALSEIFARYPAFEATRLLMSEGSQDGPAALENALAWIREQHPLLAMEIRLTESRSLDGWRSALASLAAAGYCAGLVFDPLEHPLFRLAPDQTADLLASLESARCQGGGLTSAIVFLAAGEDQSLLERTRTALAARNGAPGVHRIAVVRMDNLGDHVLGAGVFSALRAHYPHSKLVAVIPAALGELYARCPAIDAILTLPPYTAYLGDQALSSQMARHLSGCPRFDLVIHPRFAEDWYAAGMLCSNLAAPGARVLGFRQTSSPIGRYEPNACYNELLEAPDTLHSARYSDLIAQAATRHAVSAAPEVWFEPQDWDSVAARWDLQPGQFAAVGIGSSFTNKRPSTAIYQRLIRRLLAHSMPVVLIGSVGEGNLAEALRAELAGEGRVISAAGVLRLYELAALLAHARLYAGPDAGPKHMAAAALTPVLEVSWVPADFPAKSRGDQTAGACWSAWNTRARTVYPSREAFQLSTRDPQFRQKPSADVDPRDLDQALDELLRA